MLCALILCVILTAGLWPFCAPKNGVEWLKEENGLRFGHNGIVASAHSFRSATPAGACSVEIWLEPGRVDGSGTILAFDSFPDPKYPFALRQLDDSLAVQRPIVDAQGKVFRGWLKTGSIFEQGKRVVLTITGGQQKTSVYVNGVPTNVSSGFGLVNGDLTGQLVLASSTIGDSWTGQISGLAIYDFALTAPQVETHYEHWTQGQRPIIHGERAPIALYLFDERTGSTVSERMGSGNDLVIPTRYYTLHPTFLSPPWDPFRSRWDGWMSWSYWSDVCINIGGFIPLGFFFTAYFSRVRIISRPRILTVVLGLAISLVIEISQHFLPTRDSNMTDVITNTLGTLIGAALYRPAYIRKLIKAS